jgi:Zn-dependent peptidase ImmA (M78 family)
MTLRFPEVPLPIPVELWIEHPLGYAFAITDLSHLGKHVLGAAHVAEAEIVVSDAIRHEGRFRFTCAHELGHMTLHQRAAKKHNASFVDLASHPPMNAKRTNKIEWEADRFAAALLIPMPLLCRELVRACRSDAAKSFNHSEAESQRIIAEAMLNTERAKEVWRIVFLPVLSDRFGVSRSALVHRFEDITLKDGKPFLQPSVANDLLRVTHVPRRNRDSCTPRAPTSNLFCGTSCP